jgi:hypothetical protein
MINKKGGNDMTWLVNFFNNVKKFFTKLFGADAEVFMNLLEKVSPLVNLAYPIVKKVAQLTPNKTDNEILKAYESFGFQHLFNKKMDKGLALRELSKNVLRAANPDPITDYIANTAIELAYAKFKEEQGK